MQPIELRREETFPGAACCKPIELPSYKAAPLQALGNHTSLARNPVEDDDEYENENRDEDEPPKSQQSKPLLFGGI
jgi:hypothetical protein